MVRFGLYFGIVTWNWMIRITYLSFLTSIKYWTMRIFNGLNAWIETIGCALIWTLDVGQYGLIGLETNTIY